jgi:Sigma-70 region 2
LTEISRPLGHRGLGGKRVRLASCATWATVLGFRLRLSDGLSMPLRRVIVALERSWSRAFLPLIARVARVYRGSRAITRLELIQGGVVGLLRALERYDPILRSTGEPSGNGLAASTGLTHAQVGEMLALERVPQSMDEPVHANEDEVRRVW